MIPPPVAGLQAIHTVTGFKAMSVVLWARGYALCWRDDLGATVYNRAGRTSHWQLVRDESAPWDVALTCSGLLWAVAPQPWPARERAALTAGYVRAVADLVVLPPPARWLRLMWAGERE